MIFRVTFTMFYRRIWNIVGKYSILCCDIITTLIFQLAARVGKSRATPICPFLYHLYEWKELLKPEEEISWKI
jgi:hypothetical protein